MSPTKLLRTAGGAACSLLLISTFSFILLRLLPGDPARMILGPLASEEAVTAFRAAEHMDAPWWKQMAHALVRLGHGDFGQSFVQRRPVAQILSEHAPTTLGLVVVSMLWMLILGCILPACLHALGATRLRKVYRVTMTVFGASPSFATAVLLAAFFSGMLGWASAVFTPSAIASWLLPALALAAYPAALLTTLFDDSMQRAVRGPYARASRSLGQTHAVVVLREAMPNVWPSLLGAAANGMASFVAGSIGVEVVFSMPGLGGITYQAIRNNDFPLLGGTVTCYGAAMVVMTTLLRLAAEGRRTT